MTNAPASQIDEAIERHRAALLRQDTAVLDVVNRRWRVVQARLQRDVDALLDTVGDTPITPGQLRRLQRYQDLLEQTEQQVQTYADGLAPIIQAGQRTAIAQAGEQARALVLAQMGDRATWNTLPVAATNEMIGALQDGSPLTEYLGQFGPSAAAAAEEALISGVARGVGVKVLTAELEKIFGKRGAADPGAIGRKAMLTSRQSILGAYRSASLENYKANSDIIEGWIWHASLSRRTCAICWSMHGTLHKVDEPFASHIACRCSPVPLTKSWEALGLKGIPETRPDIESGADAFARLSGAEQREVLGPGKLELYLAGVPLSAFVQETQSRVWGKGRRVRALRDIENAPPQRDSTLFANVDEAHEWASRNYQKWAASLTEDEQRELRDYQYSYHRDINGMLRNDEEIVGDWRVMVDEIDRAIARGVLSRDVVAYRGFSGDYLADNLDDLVGGTITDNGYTSTSLDPSIGDKFRRWAAEEGKTPIIAEIRAPKGTRGAYMPVLRDTSEDGYEYYKNEYELLLPRGTTLRIVSTSTDVDENNNTFRRMVMEIVDG